MTAITIATSEKSLMDNLHRLSCAGGSIIQIRTREPMRAAMALRKHFVGAGAPYNEWISSSGNRRFTQENITDFVRQADDDMTFNAAFMKPLQEPRTATSEVHTRGADVHYYAFINAHHWIGDNPVISDLIAEYNALLPSSNVCILLITTDAPLRGVNLGDTLSTDFPTPSAPELIERLQSLVGEAINADGDDVADEDRTYPKGSEVTEEDYAAIAAMGLGMTHAEFEAYTALALVKGSEEGLEAVTAELLMSGVAEGKTAVVKQSEILELTQPGDINNVGGMHRLKEWLRARRNAYSQEAIDFGVETPKGVALVGVPGSGKSLVAKACSSVFNVPLIRLDFGRVFSKYIGDSESRVRAALAMVESMAPCVLFVDEIDKGLGGVGSGGDSGTSMRVLGTFLTWLQETKAPVFTMVTMNRTQGLPPELLRRGRFDQIFSVTLPDEVARREILAIHLRLRGRDIEDFPATEVDEFIQNTEGYVAAELESIVKDALILAFNDGKAKELATSHLIAAAKDLIPMSRSNKESIDAIVNWAKNNAVSVEHERTASTATAPASRSRMRTPMVARGGGR